MIQRLVPGLRQIPRDLGQLERRDPFRFHQQRPDQPEKWASEVRLPRPNQQTRLLGEGHGREIRRKGHGALLLRHVRGRRALRHKWRGKGRVLQRCRDTGPIVGHHRRVRQQHGDRVRRS